MPNLSQIIQNLGFSENESQVYLALLELGSANVAAIANKSQVKRTSCYVILENLTQKGLVSKTVAKGKTQYLAEAPDHLLRLTQERQEILKQTLPEFNSLFNLSQTKPRIRFYEGRTGYISICEDSLQRSGNEILFIGNLDNLHEVVTPEWDNTVYIPTRVRTSKSIRIITLESDTMKNLQKKDQEQLREIRFLPGRINFDASMFIYGDTISIISSEKELMGLIIDSKPIAQMAKSMFEFLWPVAK
ncbi:MAG: helix-turn-helix domain-containing protein [Patescibacteria group bacterium]